MPNRFPPYLAAVMVGTALVAGSATGPVAAADQRPTAAPSQIDEREPRRAPRCRMVLRRIDYFESRVAADARQARTAERRLRAARAAHRHARGRKARARAARRVAQRRRELREARVTLNHTRKQLRAARAEAETLNCTS